MKRLEVGSIVLDRFNRNTFVGLVIDTKKTNSDVYSASVHMKELVNIGEEIVYVFFAERPMLSRWMFSSEVKNMLPDKT
jgi:hypothetical protein